MGRKPYTCIHNISPKNKCIDCQRESKRKYERKITKNWGKIRFRKPCEHGFLSKYKCEICRKIWQKQYDKNRSEDKKLSDKTYRLTHKEEIKSRKDKWNEDNKDYIKLYSEEYDKTHKEELKIRGRKYRDKNPDKVREHKAKRYRQLGFNPMNNWFVGSEGHHINKEDIIYIPKWLHRFIYHNVYIGYHMDLINNLVFEYLELTNQVVWSDQ